MSERTALAPDCERDEFDQGAQHAWLEGDQVCLQREGKRIGAVLYAQEARAFARWLVARGFLDEPCIGADCDKATRPAIICSLCSDCRDRLSQETLARGMMP
jgi:hypothetical protein